MASETSLKLKQKRLPNHWDEYHWLSRFLEKWPLWGVAGLLTAVGLGGFSALSLITQPSKANCDYTFWPFAPASVRLYCAQELAEDPTLENLLDAIRLVDVLGENHPLRGAINPRIELWSNMALDRAEASFHKGDLKRAIRFAEKIPQKTAAAKLVKDRVAQWKEIWAEGEAINAKVNAALGEENWRKSFGIMVDLLYVGNRYWSETRYNEITSIIIQAQKDEKKVAKAERLAKRGGLENLNQAVKVVRELPATTIFTKSIAKVFDSVGKQLIQMAERALSNEDLYRAMDALAFIPRESQYWKQSKVLYTIANATALTWNASSESYLNAIEELNGVPRDSPMYGRAQSLILRWQSEIGNVEVLEAAQLKALTGEVTDLKAAITAVYAIGRESDQWEIAQDNIRDWTEQVQRAEDQPILDYASELSTAGDVPAYQAAIDQASKIAPGRALYNEARSRISYWRSRIDDFSFSVSVSPSISESLSSLNSNNLNTPEPKFSPPPDNETLVEESERENRNFSRNLVFDAQLLAQDGSPQSLAEAIELINQVPLNSLDRERADVEIDKWAVQLLNQASVEAQVNPKRAVEIARLIPPFSQVHSEAQAWIEAWEAEISISTVPTVGAP